MAAREKLGWPEPDEIFVPKGVASRLTAELADQKIGRALRALSGDSSIRLGVLSSNPDSTEAPLAIICQFSRPASAQVLLETQRLCWNFSRSLLLLTVEPTLIRKKHMKLMALLSMERRLLRFYRTSRSTRIQPPFPTKTKRLPSVGSICSAAPFSCVSPNGSK